MKYFASFLIIVSINLLSLKGYGTVIYLKISKPEKQNVYDKKCPPKIKQPKLMVAKVDAHQ